MKRLLSIALLLVFSQNLYAESIDSFWNWFVKNEAIIIQEKNLKKKTEIIYNELTKYNNRLAVIIPSVGAEPNEIVISSSAHPELKNVMNNLFEKQPKSLKIKVTKYLQPGMAYINLNIFGTVVPIENIGVIADKIKNGYSLTVFSGKFLNVPDAVILNDFGLYAIFLMGEEKLMNKVIEVNILRVSLASPDVFSIKDLEKRLK